MRFVVNILLLAAVGYCGWLWYDLANRPDADIAAESSLVVHVPEIVREAALVRRSDEQAKISGTPVDMDCFVWGPFDEKRIRVLRRNPSARALLQSAEIADRFLPDRWIVYLGPYDNDTAVRAFVKQFRHQGYPNVRPILRGGLSYGVEIETFGTQAEAQAWIGSGRAPDVQGLKVTNRFGEPSDEVDLVFRNLTPERRGALFAAWKRTKGTALHNCGYYQN